MPNFIKGVPNPASSQNAKEVREVIEDTMGGGKNKWDLQCTEYATYQVKKKLGITIDWSDRRGMSRNGGNWDNIFEINHKYLVSDTPVDNCTFHSPPTAKVPTGHVGFVEKVNSDGSVSVSECNYPGQGKYNERTVPASKWKAEKWRFVIYSNQPLTKTSMAKFYRLQTGAIFVQLPNESTLYGLAINNFDIAKALLGLPEGQAEYAVPTDEQVRNAKIMEVNIKDN